MPTSDIFGIGVLGYIALSSWSPWNSSDPKQLMVETMTLPVKYYASHWQGVSEEGVFLATKVIWFAHIQHLAAKDFISHLTEKDPEKRYSAKQALQHKWLTSSVGNENTSCKQVPPNLNRQKTAKADRLYEGCELQKALTKHAQELVPLTVQA